MGKNAESVQLFKELEQVARPLQKFLCDYYHPHAYAIVTQYGVEITEGNLAVPFTDRKD